MTVVLVLVAGGLGGLSRFLVVDLVQHRIDPTHPVGTWVVNVLGAAALGAVVALDPPGDVLAVAGTGFLGGFTTFSTWMVESLGLAQGRRASLGVAAFNAVGMAVAGIGAAALTYALSA